MKEKKKRFSFLFSNEVRKECCCLMLFGLRLRKRDAVVGAPLDFAMIVELLVARFLLLYVLAGDGMNCDVR